MKTKSHEATGKYGRIEKATVFLIPYLVIMLTVFFILDNPFWSLVDLSSYDNGLMVFDAIIIFVFSLDLVFKWSHLHNIKVFMKLYWIDILAVFPFYLILRAYREFISVFRFSEEIAQTAQTISHEAIVLRDAELLREESFLKEAKLLKETALMRALRLVQRFMRILKARFFVMHQMLHHISKSQLNSLER